MSLDLLFKMYCDECFFFFFSSRRRHTISTRDWSSDVCSSDLLPSARESRGGRIVLHRLTVAVSPSARVVCAAGGGQQTDSEDPVYLFDLTGKVAVVTGGTRGIGLMIARGLLQAGASVYISSRKPEAGEAAAAELSAHGPVVSVPADLAREEECARLAAEVGRSEERVHVLFNNAGAT